MRPVSPRLIVRRLQHISLASSEALHDIALVLFLVIQPQVLCRPEILALVVTGQREMFVLYDGFQSLGTFVFSSRTPRLIAYEHLDVDVGSVENGFVYA